VIRAQLNIARAQLGDYDETQTGGMMTLKARLYPCLHHCHYRWCHRHCLSPHRLHRVRHQCLGSQQPRQTKAVGHPHLRPDGTEGLAHKAPNVSSMRQIRQRPRNSFCSPHTNQESDTEHSCVSHIRIKAATSSILVFPTRITKATDHRPVFRAAS
jgi:hypothetical protein